jgi:hypothetical protein
MLVKIHKSYRDVVAICDSDLIGKTFEEGNRILEVRESFYNGEELDEKKTIELMKSLDKEDATFNIVGKESVNAALKAGIISKEGIKAVQGIPFALALL